MARKPYSKTEKDQAKFAVPGYTFVEPMDAQERADEDPRRTLSSSTKRLLAFIRSRDAISLLAKTGLQQLIESQMTGEPETRNTALEQAHVELLQTAVLVAGRGKAIPTSPKNMLRLWALLRLNTTAYVGTFRTLEESIAPMESITRRVRIQTIYYRNLFSNTDAAEIIPSLLSGMNRASVEELGYAMSDFSNALFEIFDSMNIKIENYRKRIRSLHDKRIVINNEINAIRKESILANRAWRYGQRRFAGRSDLGVAGLQLSELACEPFFIFERYELNDRFGAAITSALYECAIEIGSLSENILEKTYLDNPIWSRPFILLADERLFLPIPGLLISFTFLIIERVIANNDRLLKAYSEARSKYLEHAVETLVREAMPSAHVFANVKWRDPDTKEDREHDVVAVLGNQLFIFEAKAGKLRAASRRGGEMSLLKNFKELFVEPGKQASRLEQLLADGAASAGILKDRKGTPIELDLSMPYIVHKFSVCIEHFPGITTSRQNFTDIGLINNEKEWAPIFSLSELRMISTFLDTEVSFFHYMTKRSYIEDVITFMGDEQDLLSVYLTNGFCIDVDEIAGRQIIFQNADTPIRTQKEARNNRTEFATPGIFLPPFWRLIAKELYASNDRTRFGMLEVIMNQNPGALLDLANHVRKWKGGGGRKRSVMRIHTVTGGRVFGLAILMMNIASFDAREWLDTSREIARSFAAETGGGNWVVVLKIRRSHTLTYDGVSFFRLGPP